LVFELEAGFNSVPFLVTKKQQL